MSTDATRGPDRSQHWLLTGFGRVMLVWGGLLAISWLLYAWQAERNKEMQSELRTTQSSVQSLTDRVQSGQQGTQAGLEELRSESQALLQRLDEMERLSSVGEVRVSGRQPSSDDAESKRAVERARVAVLAAQAKSSQERIAKLQELTAEWQARLLTVTTGDIGRRIAGSPPHIELTAEIIDYPLPDADTVLQWQLQMEALAAPIDHAMEESDRVPVITSEHAEMLTDLGKQIAEALASFQQQQLLLEAVIRETADFEPAELTFDEFRQQRQADIEREAAERMLAAREAARREAEAEQAARLAKLEQEQVAEETRILEFQQQARTQGLKAEADRLSQAAQKAQLEREFQRDLPQVRSLLVAFTTPGFSHRADGTKGPVSLSLLQAEGATTESRRGMERLMRLASVKNDRPRGGIPQFLGGDLEWQITNKEPIERAQRLLNKYGELMVEKGMLAP